MIEREHRIRLFGYLFAAFGGWMRPSRVAGKWRAAMLDADLRASLIELAELNAPHVDEKGRCLSAGDLARRAGMADLARAIFALAGVTETEMARAIEDWNNERQRLDGIPDDPRVYGDDREIP